MVNLCFLSRTIIVNLIRGLVNGTMLYVEFPGSIKIYLSLRSCTGQKFLTKLPNLDSTRKFEP